MISNIDAIVVIVFLILNLLVGIYYGRKVDSIKEYALGGRNFSTITLASTLVATWIGGSSLNIKVAETYTKGLFYITTSIVDPLTFLIIAYILAPRMKEFLGKLSIADAMGNLYGTKVRFITAISGVVGTIGYIAIQFKVAAGLFNYFLGVNSFYATILSSIVVISYSSYRGIRAVTFTDILQFFTFGVFIPGLAILIWGTINDFSKVVDTLTNNKLFDYKEVFNPGRTGFLSWIGLTVFFLIPGFDPAVFQRISMAKNTAQVQRTFVVAALLCTIIGIMMYWVGILLLSANDTINPRELIGYVLTHYSYPGLIGFTIIGILAMVMSTADSYINSSAVLIVNDILKPLGLIVSEHIGLILSRIISVIIGIVAIIPAFSPTGLREIIVITFSFYMPIVTVPFIMAILGFRSTSRSVLIGMTAGFTTVVVFYLLGLKTDGVIPAVIMNLVFFIGSHYLMKQPGGWMKITIESNYRESWNYYLKNYVKGIKKFNIFRYCRDNAPKNESLYSLFGLFCIISVFSTMYSIPFSIREKYHELLDIIYHSILISSTIFLTYPIWPTTVKIKTYISVMWFLGLFWMLSVGIWQVLISNFGQFQLMIFLLNIVILAAITTWQKTIFFIVTSLIVSVQFFKWYMNITFIDNDFGSLQFKVIYCLLLVSSVLVVFFKPRQERQEVIESQNEDLTSQVQLQSHELHKALGLKEQFIRNIEHEYHAPMTGIVSMAHLLDDSYNELTEEQRRTIAGTIFKSSLRLERFDDNIRSLAKLNKMDYSLSMVLINLSELVYERVKRCRKLYEDNKEDREFILNIEENLTVRGDKQYLSQLLDNLIINAISYCKAGKIRISLRSIPGSVPDNTEDNDDTRDARDNMRDRVEFSIIDEGVGIPENELKEIFGIFNVSSRTSTMAGGRGVGLALCKRVAELHDGEISAMNNHNSPGASFIFTLPKAG